MTAAPPVDRKAAWDAIADAVPRTVGFAADDCADLPPPARRLLQRALPAGEVAVTAVLLDMEGEIKLKRWLPFTARQILHPTEGFVWNATVGPWWLRFRGGDAVWGEQGSLEFRLAGLVPVVRAAGPDVARSAAGRLVAETAAWVPQALLPAAGASWRAVDDRTAIVSRPFNGEPTEVTVVVDDEGRLQELRTMRWGDPDGGEPGFHPFGGAVTAAGVFNGITVAAAGTVGWWWGTDRQSEGEFFRYRIRNVQPTHHRAA